MDSNGIVVGPAYLDWVLRVDRPLIEAASGPIDRSTRGRWDPEDPNDPHLLTLRDPREVRLEIEVPADWDRGQGVIRLADPLSPGLSAVTRRLKTLEWDVDLGGMGAGYAKALNATLVSALGPESDLTSRRITEKLAAAGVRHEPIRVPDHPADWTLLVTSGPFGDKLPVGFRGCHAAVKDFLPERKTSCGLFVAASLNNVQIQAVLDRIEAETRLFAPSIGNMRDSPPVSAFADRIDALCCNRLEWEALTDRGTVERTVPLIAVTDGPKGGRISYRNRHAERSTLEFAAFPRRRPPADTNRAGEAFASTLIRSLRDAGWRRGALEERPLRAAVARASAAAALVLDRLDFGFPGVAEIDAALARGLLE